MNITADSVKQLRERTGAGMMECKRALVETQGDLDAAAELMRKTGLAKADKKSARVAAEGAVAVERGSGVAAMAEVNCETDFVARGNEFLDFARAVAGAALQGTADDVAALLAQAQPGGPPGAATTAAATTGGATTAAATTGAATLDDRRRALIAKIGENISVRRFVRVAVPGAIGSYIHGGRIGALVALQGGDEALARDLAMHVAAVNPAYIDAAGVPADVLEKERAILAAQTKDEKKPPDIIAKMVEGRLRKYLAELTLLGQPFVKDPDTTIEKLLKKSGAKVLKFVRFEVGEGIEKKHDDFVGEVMAQVMATKKDESGRKNGTEPAT